MLCYNEIYVILGREPELSHDDWQTYGAYTTFDDAVKAYKNFSRDYIKVDKCIESYATSNNMNTYYLADDLTGEIIFSKYCAARDCGVCPGRFVKNLTSKKY